MTTINQAREAIYQEFVDEWGATSPLTFDNEKYKPTLGTSWVRLTVRHVLSSQDTLGKTGNRRFSRPGSVFIQVFTPPDAGASAADTLATTARDIFEGKRLLGSNLWFLDCTITELDPEPDWYPVLVECVFEYDERK